MADKQAFFKFCAFLHVVLKGTYPRWEYITSCFIGKFIAHTLQDCYWLLYTFFKNTR